jgi:hypothetical protein
MIANAHINELQQQLVPLQYQHLKKKRKIPRK